MKTIEIIRNSVMQCIEKIEALIKRISKTEATVKEQGNTIKDAKISLSVMENFASSQFANFTYLYYEEFGLIKSMLFNDGNVSEPQIYSYVISGKPLSYRCWNRTQKVEFKNFDTSAVTDMSSMFIFCNSITSLDVSNFNTSAVTNMSGMFNSCKKLASLDVSNFDTSAVTDMSSMFSQCYVVTSLDLSNFDTAAVTNMHEMFYYCQNLTTLDISNIDTSSVTNTGSMFYECTSLTSIVGTHTLEEVQAGTIKALKGTKVSLDLSASPLLERASILALFYGLADLTGNAKQTISLHASAKARLTAEDIKIATDKNWNIQ